LRVNFEIIATYALKIGKRHIDLHNCFDFAGFSYAPKNRLLVLNWKQSKGDWVASDEPKALSLIHKQTSFIKIEKDSSIVEDDNCLGYLGYYPATDRNNNEYVQDQTTPTSDDDLIYQFQSGWFIRVKAEEIELVI
jgi:hypothetical protein